MANEKQLINDISKLLKSGAYIPYSYNVLVGVLGSLLLILVMFGLKQLGDLQDSTNKNDVELATIETTIKTTITDLDKAISKIDEVDDELQEHILSDALRGG